MKYHIEQSNIVDKYNLIILHNNKQFKFYSLDSNSINECISTFSTTS